MPSAAVNLILFAPSYCAESQAFFARLATPPSIARKRLYDSLIRATVSAGVWDKLDALYIFAAHDAATARANLKSASFAITEVNSPTFAADRGNATNGTTSYIDSNFNGTTAPSPKYTRDSASFGFWQRTSGQTASGVGQYDATDGALINPRNTSDLSVFIMHETGTPTVASADGSGFWLLNRSAAGAVQLYKNGSSVATSVGASVAINNITITLGFANGTVLFAAAEYAAAVIGQSLNPGDNTALYAALHAYMVAVGAAA